MFSFLLVSFCFFFFVADHTTRVSIDSCYIALDFAKFAFLSSKYEDVSIA